MQNDLQGALVKVVWEPHLKFGLADDFYVDALEVILHLYDTCCFISAICNIQFNVQESAAQQLGLNEEDIMFKYSYSNTISLFAIVMIGRELHIVFNYTLNVSNSIVFSRCSSSRNSLRGITHSTFWWRCYLQLWWYFLKWIPKDQNPPMRGS